MVCHAAIKRFFRRNCRTAARLGGFMILAVQLLRGGAMPNEAWRIAPGGAAGAIKASTSRQELMRRYGAANVVDQDIEEGEGNSEPGTVLFPNDPQRRIEILWKDTKTKLAPSSLTTAIGKSSLWNTAHGISLGTCLKELERVNGRPFALAGFGWDYGGTVTSWNDGALAHEFDSKGRVVLRLDYQRQPAVSMAEEDEVQGDRDFSSSHAVMQKLNPCVYQMVWVFP